MNEATYRAEAEKIFAEIENEIDSYDWDFDYDNKGDILVIYNDGLEYMVLTKNFSRQEIWLVAGKDAFHFVSEKEQWISTKNHDDTLLLVIRRYLDLVSGEKGQIF